MTKVWSAEIQALDDAGREGRFLGMQALIDAIPEAVLVLSPAQTILNLNRSAAKLFACRPQDVLGLSFAALAGVECVASDQGAPVEAVGRRGDGALFPLEISVMPMGELLVATIRDTTESKRAEAERLALGMQFFHAQKMEALGVMAEWVAHDVGNILNGMLACNEFVREQLPAGDPAEKVLDSAMRAGMRGRDVVGQMLAFGRAEPGEAEAVDLVQIVRDAAALLPCSEKHGIRLDIEAEPSVPAVKGCAAQIYQVVVNLFVNAVQATAPGGQLKVAIRAVGPEERPATPSGEVEMDGACCRLRLGHAGDGPMVCLRVADNGAGMAPEILAHIFEPFFTTKRAGKGSGLGLSAVFGIVSQQGGAIAVRTCQGEGSTFDIFLPVAQ